MLNDNHLIEHHFFRIRNTELNEIYAVMSLRTFILGMVGLFSSVYLYTIGFSIQDIFLVELVVYTSEALFEFAATSFIAKYGPKHSIALSLPILATYYWLLWSIPTYHWPIWFFPVVGGTSIAFFWQAYHFDFSRAKSRNSASKDVSKMYILMAVLAAVAPVIGGTIATNYGFHVLLITCAGLLLFSAIPLLKNGEKHKPHQFSASRINMKKIRIQLVSYAGSNIEAATAGTVWPLFIFLILGTAQKVGVVTSAALIATVVITYYVGRKGDGVDKRKYIRTGSRVTAVTYFVRAFVTTLSQIFVLNLFYSISHSMFASTYVTEYYQHADENARAEYVFLMELVADISKIFLFGIMYLLGFWFSGMAYLSAGLIVGGLGTLLICLMPASKIDLKNATIHLIPKLRPSREIS